MRSFGRTATTFWTVGEGRKIRGNAVAIAVYGYLKSAPSSTLIGLYYLPICLMVCELGLAEADIRGALARLSTHGIAHYDDERSLVWVPSMAADEVGPSVVPRDRRHQAILAALAQLGSHRFVDAFLKLYGTAYNLARGILAPADHMPSREAPSEGPRSPSEAPSEAPRSPSEAPPKPLRSQNQDQDQDQDQDQPTPTSARAREEPVPDEPPAAAPVPIAPAPLAALTPRAPEPRAATPPARAAPEARAATLPASAAAAATDPRESLLGPEERTILEALRRDRPPRNILRASAATAQRGEATALFEMAQEVTGNALGARLVRRAPELGGRGHRSGRTRPRCRRRRRAHAALGREGGRGAHHRALRRARGPVRAAGAARVPCGAGRGRADPDVGHRSLGAGETQKGARREPHGPGPDR